MPHFIIDCSESVISLKSPKAIMQSVYDVAAASGLFEEGDIKVRIHPFEHYTIGNTKANFLHIFANIMEGRNSKQKRMLSQGIISELKKMFPEVPIISINIRDFEKATYCNRSMV